MSDETRLIEALRRAAGLPAGPIERFDHGASGDIAVRLGDAFGKITDPRRRISREGLAREIAALRWLDGRAGAPRLLWFGEVEGRPAMLVEALPGAPAHELPAAEAEVGLVAVIEALRDLHRLPIDGCPLDQQLPAKTAEARRRVAEGEAKGQSDDPDRSAPPTEAHLRALLNDAPGQDDLVFTHGDPSLPNFILAPAGRTGVVDLGLAGVGDRYWDLAIFLRSAAFNFPDIDARPLLIEHYPLPAFDDAKAKFFRRLDAFF